MSEERFTNRELKLMFEQIDSKLDGIQQQTTKTNGRVTKLEGKAEVTEKQLTIWKAYVTTVGAIVGFFGLPTIIQFLQTL